MTAKELRDLTLRVPDDAEVRVSYEDCHEVTTLEEACGNVSISQGLGRFIVLERV